MLVATLIAAAAVAQDTNLVERAAIVRPGVWLPRLGGTIQDGGAKLDLETDIFLRDREATFLGEFELRPVDHLTLEVSTFDFSVSNSGTFSGNTTFGGMALRNGDLWSGTVEMQSVGIEASWDMVRPYPRGGDTMLTFAPLLGAQWYGVDLDLRNITTGTSVTRDESWEFLYGGARMDLGWDTSEHVQWLDSLSIDAAAGVGSLVGGDGGTGWMVRVGMAFEFAANTSLYFGYRLRELNAESGSYTFDAGLQGLFIGGQIRF
jgi:hypothetical protein